MEQLVLAFVIGAICAAAAVWAWLSSRLKSVKAEHSQAEGALTDLRIQHATLAERVTRVDELNSEKAELAASLEDYVQQVNRFGEERARLEATLQGREQALEESQKVLEKAKEEFKEAFAALSGDALEKNNRMFLDLAKRALERDQESAKTELETRKVAIEELVKPLSERLDKVNDNVTEIEKRRVEAYATLGEMVKGLGDRQGSLEKETRNLVHALRTPVRRGQWGEITLKRLAEMAGMIEYCDFEQQVSVGTNDGRLRPDMVVRLPNNMSIVVDSKVALDAYMEATSEDVDEDVRKTLMAKHAQQVKTHIDQLSLKAYWDQFEHSPDFVVMLLPAEPLFSAALEADATLIHHGMEKRVLIATPVTLIALLRTANIGWQQVALEQDARKIAEAGKELLKRFVKVGEDLQSVGRHLEGSVKAYNAMVSSVDSRLMPKFRDFERFQGVDSAAVELPDLKAIDLGVKEVQARELQALPFGLDD